MIKPVVGKRRTLSDKHLALLANHEWRIQNLYWIKAKNGGHIRFRMNAEQLAFFRSCGKRNLILKARQLGFTTLVCILMLDLALFDHAACALIAHKVPDANRFFRDKIKFAYDRLPIELRKANPASIDRTDEIVFAKGGSVTVSTSFRGGTLQYLHVSEFGKICARDPIKAEEIVTGALEAVSADGAATFESTAEGRAGYYYRWCTDSLAAQKRGERRGSLDWKVAFYPWWGAAEYKLEAEEVGAPLTEELIAYFERLKNEHGITLTQEQKDWYAGKLKTLGDKMLREYPSFPEEAFAQAIEGAYYARQFRELYAAGRICPADKFPDNSHLPVSTFWDLGVDDSTAVWFVRKVGSEYHIIDYYATNDEGLQHYVKMLYEKADRHGYVYDTHWAPHDIGNREWGTGKTRLQQAREGYMVNGKRLAIKFRVVPNIHVVDGIELVRDILPKCVFNATTCGADRGTTEDGAEGKEIGGIVALEMYRKEWDAKRGCWKGGPLHDHTSHGADAFRYFAVAMQRRSREVKRRRMGGMV